jgi:hypothetical protein
MISMLPTQPMVPTQGNAFDAFLALMTLMSDPAAAKKRLAEFVDAGLKANEAILAANKGQQDLVAAKKLQDEALQRERAELEQANAVANAAIASKDLQVNSQLAERERLVAEREVKAAADAAAAAGMKADLSRRLAGLREIAL